MKVAVLFDGAGLARLGLEKAGLKCYGYEKDPRIYLLGKYVGQSKTYLQDALTVDLSDFDAVWASPPCQSRSIASNCQNNECLVKKTIEYVSKFPNIKYFWLENVLSVNSIHIGEKYNAAQFMKNPIQNRPRIIYGDYPKPKVYRGYQNYYPELNLCPTITATEYKYSIGDKRRASRKFNRRLSIDECAYYQGFEIPTKWKTHHFIKDDKKLIYKVIGNGVPIYMAKAFGEALCY